MRDKKIEKMLKKSIEKIECENRLAVIKKDLVFLKQRKLRLTHIIQFSIIAITISFCIAVEIVSATKSLVVKSEISNIVIILALVWLGVLIKTIRRK